MLFSSSQKLNLNLGKTKKNFWCGSICAGLYPLCFVYLIFLEFWRIIWFLFNLLVTFEFEFKASNKPSEKCLEIVFLGSETLLKFTFKVSQLLYFYYYF